MMNEILPYRKPAGSFLLLSVALGLALNVSAATVYVSPTGKTEAEGGAGTFADPYDLATGYEKGKTGEIRFLPGTYELTSTLKLCDGASFVGWKASADEPAGLEGRDDVILDGQGTVGVIGFNGSGTGSKICDLTIRNGTTGQGGLASFPSVYGHMLVTNCVFRDTTASNGCALESSLSSSGSSSSTMTFADCDFRDITATSGWSGDASCGIVKPYSTLFLRCRFFNNTQNCSAYSCFSYGSADFTDCVISNNTGKSDGGFRMTKAKFTRCRFADNTVTSGALVTSINSASELSLTDCSFTNNVCGSGCVGLAQFVSANGTLAVTNCAFVANQASNGGAVYLSHTGWKATFTHCGFTNNVATSNGGAMYLQTSLQSNDILVDGCDFYGNSAGSWGGAVDVLWSQGATFRNCLFETNTASYSAAIHNGTGTSGQQKNQQVIDGCTFRHNVAQTYCAVRAVAVISNSTFIGNNATRTSDRIGPISFIAHNQYNTEFYWTNCVVNCLIDGNVASAVKTEGDYLLVADTTIRGTTNGPAFDLRSASTCLIDRCYVISNQTSGAGAAILQTYANSNNAKDIRIRNSLFVGNRNTGSYGGGGAAVVALADNTYVENCTFVENWTPTGLYGALQFARNVDGPFDRPRCINTLFYRNGSTYGCGTSHAAETQFCASGVSTNYYYNCYSWTGALPPDRNNINATAEDGNNDPKFVDFDALDFCLQKKSPCINAGSNETWMVGARDIRNGKRIPRIITRTVDIGCYEYKPLVGLKIIFQ